MFPPQDIPPNDSFLTTPWSLLFATKRPANFSKADEEFAAFRLRTYVYERLKYFLVAEAARRPGMGAQFRA